jgi:hypothetical protein
MVVSNGMVVTRKGNIILFLFNVKNAISNGNIEWIPRSYNGLTILGLNLDNASDIICGLTPKEYYRGPSPDFNGDGTDVWEFIYILESDGKIPVYIKLKFQSEKCKVLSFHESNKPFEQPYNESN